MKRAMVDTDVLILGTKPRSEKDDENRRRMMQDSRSLLLSMEQVRVSVITVAEFLPTMSVEDERDAATTLAKLRQEALDPPAMAEAVRLIRKMRNDPSRCTLCLGPKKAQPCKRAATASAACSGSTTSSSSRPPRS